jgi:hypothetical protein
MRSITFSNTATDLATQKVPFLANNTVLILNFTGGTLTLQDSADNSTYGTLASCPAGVTVVTLNKQYVKVSTAANLFAVGN